MATPPNHELGANGQPAAVAPPVNQRRALNPALTAKLTAAEQEEARKLHSKFLEALSSLKN